VTPERSGTPGLEGTAASAAQANEVDVDFAQGMIPHHGQALEMAQAVAERSSNPEIVALAEQIEAAQAPEIALMSTWLESWGEDVPDPRATDHAQMDHSVGSGMMTETQMEDLMGMRDRDFDRMFLEMMIEHHEGAVGMSEHVIALGLHGDVKELAKQIIVGQQAEIALMQQMLQD
jgi:uncharacterized protein (DUF305 family)